MIAVGFFEELHSGGRCHELGRLANVSTGLQNIGGCIKVKKLYNARSWMCFTVGLEYQTHSKTKRYDVMILIHSIVNGIHRFVDILR